MEVMCNSKGGIHSQALIPTMLIMIMMLLNAYCCGAAAVLAESNTSFRRSGGRLDEWLIEEELELELGILMNPYVSRILAGNTESDPNSKNRDKPAYNTNTCGGPNDPTYAACIAKLKPNQRGCVSKNPLYRGC